MGMAYLYKEYVTKKAWAMLLRDLELPADTDEICIKDINHITETQRKANKEKNDASDNNRP